jgi:hypothetical protein
MPLIASVVSFHLASAASLFCSIEQAAELVGLQTTEERSQLRASCPTGTSKLIVPRHTRVVLADPPTTTALVHRLQVGWSA